MIKIIPIGTNVEVNNTFTGMVISASIRKTHVVYEVQQTREEDMYSLWANDWEITSTHKEKTIISQCMERESEKGNK